LYNIKSMITSRLKTIFALSIPLFIAHGIEEIMTGMYDVDNQVHFLFSPLANFSSQGATFVVFQVMLWLLLIVSFLLLLGPKWQFRLLAVVGLLYLYEFSHILGAISVGGYYPGLWTALLFPVVAFFYWKELLGILMKR